MGLNDFFHHKFFIVNITLCRLHFISITFALKLQSFFSALYMFAFRDTSAVPTTSQPAAAPPQARTYLNVPYAQKDEAKALGARWDNVKRQWYAPNDQPILLERWGVKPVVPLAELEGEVRDFGPTTLVIDFGPKSCWCKKIRYALKPDDFKRVEALVIGRTSRTCEACGVVDPEQADRLDVQARWEY